METFYAALLSGERDRSPIGSQAGGISPHVHLVAGLMSRCAGCKCRRVKASAFHDAFSVPRPAGNHLDIARLDMKSAARLVSLAVPVNEFATRPMRRCQSVGFAGAGCFNVTFPCRVVACVTMVAVAMNRRHGVRLVNIASPIASTGFTYAHVLFTYQ